MARLLLRERPRMTEPKDPNERELLLRRASVHRSRGELHAARELEEQASKLGDKDWRLEQLAAPPLEERMDEWEDEELDEKKLGQEAKLARDREILRQLARRVPQRRINEEVGGARGYHAIPYWVRFRCQNRLWAGMTPEAVMQDLGFEEIELEVLKYISALTPAPPPGQKPKPRRS